MLVDQSRLTNFIRMNRDSLYISGGSSASALVSAPPSGPHCVDCGNEDFCPLPAGHRAQLGQQKASFDAPVYTSCLETSLMEKTSHN